MYLYKILSYKLVGLCMEVHRQYGRFQKEKVYHNALKEKLELNEIKYISQPRLNIKSPDTGNTISYYIPDFLIDDKIIVEIKAVPFNPQKFELQLLNYIRNSIYELSYLINFGLPSLYFKRIIFTNNNKDFMTSVKK